MSYFASPSPKLPTGYRLLRMETVDSTNAEAKRRAKAGEPGPLWIWSARQSQGRGRGGREWISQHGNLFASLLIGDQLSDSRCRPARARRRHHRPIDTIAKLIAYEGRSELLLKWPNDVLLAGEKLAGMLLENVGSPAENRSVVVIGTGINLANHPEDLPQPAISLGAYGMTITPADALEVLAATTHEWLVALGRGHRLPEHPPRLARPRRAHRASAAGEDQRRGNRRRLCRARCRRRAPAADPGRFASIGSPPAMCSSSSR